MLSRRRTNAALYANLWNVHPCSTHLSTSWLLANGFQEEHLANSARPPRCLAEILVSLPLDVPHPSSLYVPRAQCSPTSPISSLSSCQLVNIEYGLMHEPATALLVSSTSLSEEASSRASLSSMISPMRRGSSNWSVSVTSRLCCERM